MFLLKIIFIEVFLPIFYKNILRKLLLMLCLGKSGPQNDEHQTRLQTKCFHSNDEHEEFVSEFSKVQLDVKY